MSKDATEAVFLNSLTTEYEPFSLSAIPLDEAIVKKAADGDHAAFESLFMATYRYVFVTVRRYLKNDQDAYDAIQETYLRVYKGLHRLESASSFYPWLHRIAENCAKDLLASLGRDATLPLDDDFEIPDEDKSPAADVTADIADVLKQLAPEQAELLIRVYYDKMRVAEIAKMQGIPATTVYNRLISAKKKLRELLRIRGIEKPFYGGSLVAMVSAAIRNAIGTELLSLAVAEEILHTVTQSRNPKGAFVISRFARTARSKAAIKIASLILFTVALITAAAIVITGVATGVFYKNPTPDGESNLPLPSQKDESDIPQSGDPVSPTPTVSDTADRPPTSTDDKASSDSTSQTASDEETDKFDFYFSMMEEEVELRGAFANTEIFGTNAVNAEPHTAVSGDTLYAVVNGDLVSLKSGDAPRLMIENFGNIYGKEGNFLNVFEGKVYWLGKNGNEFTLNRCNTDGSEYYSVPFTDFAPTFMTKMTVAADGVYFIAGVHGGLEYSGSATLYRTDFDFNTEKTKSGVADYTLIRNKIYYLYGIGNRGELYCADRASFQNAVNVSPDHLFYQTVCSVGDYIVFDGYGSYGHNSTTCNDLKIIDTISGKIVRAIYGEGGYVIDVKSVSEQDGGIVLFQYNDKSMTMNIKTGKVTLVPDHNGTLFKNRKYFIEDGALWICKIDGTDRKKAY